MVLIGFPSARTDSLRPDGVVAALVKGVPKLFALESLPKRGKEEEEKNANYVKAGYSGTIFVFYESNPLEIAYPKEFEGSLQLLAERFEERIVRMPAIDIDVMMTGKPRSLRESLQRVIETVAELERETGTVEETGLVTAIIDKLASLADPDIKIDEKETRRLIGQLVKEGILYYPKPGRIKRTAA